MPTIVTKADFDLARQFIIGDISREIELAKAWHDPLRQPIMLSSRVQPSGGGNFLAALGLLCYTEFCGWLKYNHIWPPGHRRAGEPKARDNFDSFFDDLGPSYKTFRQNGHKVYDVFRCGMAHQYFVKLSSYSIAMPGVGNATMGITHNTTTGYYTFVVEKYFQDLCTELPKLDAHLTPLFPLQRP